MAPMQSVIRQVLLVPNPHGEAVVAVPVLARLLRAERVVGGVALWFLVADGAGGGAGDVELATRRFRLIGTNEPFDPTNLHYVTSIADARPSSAPVAAAKGFGLPVGPTETWHLWEVD
jgi:hypothetical protein